MNIIYDFILRFHIRQTYISDTQSQNISEKKTEEQNINRISVKNKFTMLSQHYSVYYS